jgi:hypothetical protein
LSRIYDEQAPESKEAVFEGKEVLLKVITLNSTSQTKDAQKLRLIEAISEATNLQTAVITADRYSNETVNLQLQQLVFDRYGLLFERKRGEFDDGLHNGYIETQQIIERNLFFRLLLAANGDLKRAIQKRLFARLSKSGWQLPTEEQMDRFYFAFRCLNALRPKRFEAERNKEIYARLYVLTSWYMPKSFRDVGSVTDELLKNFQTGWETFVKQHESDKRFLRPSVDPITRQPTTWFDRAHWVRSGGFPETAERYFSERAGKKAAGISAELSGPEAVGKVPDGPA